MQEYIWVAQYKNGSTLMEFEANGTENSFYKIERDSLSSFGLLGGGNAYSFNVNDGVLRINGKPVNILYDSIPLTGRGNYSDIITYKDAEAKFNPNGHTSNAITKFNVGYKAKVADLSIRVIYTVYVTGKNYISVRLVSDTDRNGELSVGRYKIAAPLKANIGMEIKVFEEVA